MVLDPLIPAAAEAMSNEEYSEDLTSSRYFSGTPKASMIHFDAISLPDAVSLSAPVISKAVPITGCMSGAAIEKTDWIPDAPSFVRSFVSPTP